MQFAACPRILRIKIRISCHANERRFRFWRRTDAPVGFLVNVEPDETFDEWETGAEGGNDFIDPLAFVSPHLSGGHLSNHDRLFLGCKEGVDVLENLVKGLPATVCRTPVVPIDPGPIDVSIAWVVVHRILVTSVDIRDVWTPRPDHVGSTRGNEDVVNMSISGNVQGCIVATPRFVTIHLRCEVEEEHLAERFGAVCTRYYRGIEAPVDDLGEVDLVGSQLTRGMRPAARSALVTVLVQSLVQA